MIARDFEEKLAGTSRGLLVPAHLIGAPEPARRRQSSPEMRELMAIAERLRMRQSLQSWQETLINSSVDGTALTASTTATSIIPPAAKLTLPQGFFQVGRMIKVTAQGRISNIVTTPGTLTLDIRFGAVIVANGGAISLNAVAKTNVPFWLEWLLTCRAIGSGTSANMMHQGQFMSESVVGSPLPTAGGNGSLLIPVSAPAVGSGFDSTAAQTVDLFATWSLNNANSIQTHQFKVESLN